jgi:hypothetical protein
MPNYSARLNKLEQQMGADAPVRFVWMNPGETHREAVARYVEQHKLGVHPDVFLALAKAEHAGNRGIKRDHVGSVPAAQLIDAGKRHPFRCPKWIRPYGHCLIRFKLH